MNQVLSMDLVISGTTYLYFTIIILFCIGAPKSPNLLSLQLRQLQRMLLALQS